MAKSHVFLYVHIYPEYNDKYFLTFLYVSATYHRLWKIYNIVFKAMLNGLRFQA